MRALRKGQASLFYRGHALGEMYLEYFLINSFLLSLHSQI